MKTDVLFSGDSAEWETPQALFDAMNEIHGFTLDAAATKENAKCAKFFTREDNALTRSWAGETVWLNPPYGRKIAALVRKAYEESRNPGTTVVVLLPARTDTKWFHDYAIKVQIKFLKGRLKFGGSVNNAPFPSMIVTFE